MRILVIGGTGFIGPHAVRLLAAMGHEVTVFHRGETEADLAPEVRHLHHGPRAWGDRGHFAEFAPEFQRLAPDVVLDMILMNEADARAAVETFRGLVGRLVAVSSEDVYRAYDRLRGKDPGPVDPVPLTEDSPLRDRLYPYHDDARPVYVQGSEDRYHRYEKILVERVVMSEPELPGTVLRLPAVYGPGDGRHRLFPYLKRMDDGRPAILMSEGQAPWRWSRGYVENVGAAIAMAVADERAAGRIYNAAEPEALPEAEWARRIGQAAGWSGEIVTLPGDHLPEHLRSTQVWEQHWCVDTSRIRQELGFHEPVPFEEGLRRTVAWERMNPPESWDPKQFDYAAEDAALAAFGTMGSDAGG
jgi:nucleoside-diphosphate-sugar epimerase